MADVLVLGVFDILTSGHFDMLGRARRFGHVAIGLTGDELAEATKRKPLFGFDERRQRLELLGFTVVERATADARPVFEAVRPRYYVCGNDHLGGNHIEDSTLSRELFDGLDVTVVYVPRVHDISTTKVLDRVRERLATEGGDL